MQAWSRLEIQERAGSDSGIRQEHGLPVSVGYHYDGGSVIVNVYDTGNARILEDFTNAKGYVHRWPASNLLM